MNALRSFLQINLPTASCPPEMVEQLMQSSNDADSLLDFLLLKLDICKDHLMTIDKQWLEQSILPTYQRLLDELFGSGLLALPVAPPKLVRS